jgi:hypothetical protein
LKSVSQLARAVLGRVAAAMANARTKNADSLIFTLHCPAKLPAVQGAADASEERSRTL